MRCPHRKRTLVNGPEITERDTTNKQRADRQQVGRDRYAYVAMVMLSLLVAFIAVFVSVHDVSVNNGKFCAFISNNISDPPLKPTIIVAKPANPERDPAQERSWENYKDRERSWEHYQNSIKLGWSLKCIGMPPLGDK